MSTESGGIGDRNTWSFEDAKVAEEVKSQEYEWMGE